MDRKYIDEYAHSTGEKLLLADGFDDAIVGISRKKGSGTSVAYDYSKCVEILMNRDGMDIVEAEEFMEFNVVDAYVGEHTPTFIETMEVEVW